MQISNNNSTSFGSIQVGLSKMRPDQVRIADRLFNSIKYNEKYSKFTGNDLDIYLLPLSGRGIEIRFMDPFSGNFVRQNNKILKENLYGVISDKVEAVTDKVVEIYGKIVAGKIERPKEDIKKVLNNDTEMCRINPAKENDFTETVKEYKGIGHSQESAEQQAFEQYKALYHVENKDADF